MSELAPCTKAVIAAAGNGTRYMPGTKTIEKVMVLIGNTPVMHYVVRNCFYAGIRDFTFITKKSTRPGQRSQIEDYFSHDEIYEASMSRQGKLEPLDELSMIIDASTFRFIEQDVLSKDAPYGTTVPLSLALNDKRLSLKPGEPILYLYGDNVYHDKDGESTVGKFFEYIRNIASLGEVSAKTALLTTKVPAKEVNKYGIVATKPGPNNTRLYDYIAEKPEIGHAPKGNLNNGGIMLLNEDIRPFVEQGMNLEIPGQSEKQVTDVLNLYKRAGNQILVYCIDNRTVYLDGGTPKGIQHATDVICGPYHR